MIAARYIEITSLHRDRTRFPLPTSFHIELSAPDARNPRDPLYESAPVYPPPNVTSGVYSNVAYMYGVETSGSINPYYVDVIPNVVIEHGVPRLLPIQVGETIELVQQVVGGTITNRHIRRQVVRTKTIQKCIYNSTISNVLSPSSATTTIPIDIDGYLRGWSIRFNSTTDPTLSGFVRPITEFRSYDKTIFFESVEPSTLNAGDTFDVCIDGVRVELNAPFPSPLSPQYHSVSDYTTFRMRTGVETPLAKGTFVGGTTNTFTLPSSVGVTDYTGSLLWVTSDPVVYSGSFASTGFISNGTTQTNGTFILASPLPYRDCSDMYVYVTSGAFQGSTYLMSGWNSSTLTGTLNVGWTDSLIGVVAPSAGDSIVISTQRPTNFYYIHSYTPSTRTGAISPYFSVRGRPYTITSNDTFELLKFREDNYQPLDYSESMTHQQQVHCYDISLVSLSIPNVELATGDRITQYPYVYVEFRSITQGTSAYNFSSNHPIVQKVMFKAPVLYNYHLYDNAFLTLDGNGMVQQLKFKPNDSFSFVVYTPTGDVLTFNQSDTLSPSPPNPNLQVSACFGIRRTPI